MNNAFEFFFCMAACVILGVFIGAAVVNSKDHTKDFVAQCQKSQFYFADGVGIQCPAVINNRVTKGEQ